MKKYPSLRWWERVPSHLRPERLRLSKREKFGYWFLRKVVRCELHGVVALGMLADIEITAKVLYKGGQPLNATMAVTDFGADDDQFKEYVEKQGKRFDPFDNEYKDYQRKQYLKEQDEKEEI